VPVQSRLQAGQVALNVHYNDVTLTHLEPRRSEIPLHCIAVNC